MIPPIKPPGFEAPTLKELVSAKLADSVLVTPQEWQDRVNWRCAIIKSSIERLVWERTIAREKSESVEIRQRENLDWVLWDPKAFQDIHNE